MVELLTHLFGMQHAAQIDAAQKAAGHGGVHSLDGVGQLVDMASLTAVQSASAASFRTESTS